MTPDSDPMTPIRERLALSIYDLFAATNDDELTDACDELCDFIANIDTDIFSSDDLNATMRAARAIDPTESFHAAHIRDAIRDNHSQGI